jgi:hypothetical protein
MFIVFLLVRGYRSPHESTRSRVVTGRSVRDEEKYVHNFDVKNCLQETERGTFVPLL